MTIHSADVMRKINEAQLDLSRALNLLEEDDTDFIGALQDAQSTLREAERLGTVVADRIDFMAQPIEPEPMPDGEDG